MKSTPCIFLFIVVIFLQSVSFAEHIKFSEAERTIIRLQDERRGIDTIARYLDSKEEKVAWRAAIALANIKDSTSRPILISHFAKESRSYVSDGIAFALGVLGQNSQSYTALVSHAATKPTTELFIALGRTATKNEVEGFVSILASPKTPPMCAASALIEISLHKLMNEDFAKLVDGLAKNENPQVLWRAVYSFARCEDSALLSNHIPAIKEYLADIGSPESRMFAVTALGRIHNEEAGRSLIEAARSEVEWRVRVNIFNAIAKLPRFSSAIDDVIKKAVLESSKDSLTSNHIARAALDALDMMIAAGKVSSPDSITVKEWLTDYLPNHEMHEDQNIGIRSQCMIPLARLGLSQENAVNISYYISYHDRTAEINVWKAFGLIPDTLTFFHGLSRIFTIGANDVSYVLDGLHSLWEIAKKDTSYLHELQRRRFASIYSHMLIRFASQSEDPATVAVTMEHLKDPLIVTDSLRPEAEEYFLRYLDSYAYPKYHDQLLSIFNTVAWLKLKNDTIKIKLNKILDLAATDWGDQMIVDSAEAALGVLGEIHQHRIAKLIREPIDWKTIENMPDTFLVSTKYGFMYLTPKTYDAPLTTLNMYKLAKSNFLSNSYIHRVVPNFVIQTGDPSGTGDGGPGYSIRTEISPIRYDDEGAVGMASSGKDTEGSQWFVTHCPTPHLNTRYTIWGEIFKGRENIEKYLMNDQIFTVNPYR